MATPFILDDSTSNDVFFDPRYGRGGIPRDYSVQPVEMFAPPSDIQIIPRSEWSARIKEKKETSSRLRDVWEYQKVPSLNQGNVGYCWAHSVVHAVMMARAIANQRTAPLSAYAVAAIIKKGRDEGGWCGLSAKFCREVGTPSQAFWPQGSRDLKYDTPAMRADASTRRITEEWVDLALAVYDQNLTFEQAATCSLLGIPGPVDFNWWGHSVMRGDLVEVEPGSFGLEIRNSWGDDWGDKGWGILRGSKAIPDGALAIRVTSGV